MPDFIYALRCPVSGEIRYIGKSNDPKKRLHCHVSAARLKRRDHHTSRWLRTLLAQSLLPTLQILLEVPHGEDWRHHERLIISRSLAQGCRLTNQTPGGEGVSITDEADRERFRAAIKASWTAERLAGWSAISKAKWTPDQRRASGERMRAQATKLWTDPTHRKVETERTRNRMLSGQAKKMVEIQKVGSSFFEQRKAASKLRWDNPDQRKAAAERMKARNEARWANPKNRSALSEAMKTFRAQKMSRKRWGEKQIVK